MAIARSHAIIGNVTNALGLISHSFELSKAAAADLEESSADSSAPLNIDVQPAAFEFLQTLLNGELQRHRAIVHIDNLRKAEHDAAASSGVAKPPLVERLNEYPSAGVDLANIVEFPPKLALVPVKPIFLDVAWNYIDYPGKADEASQPAKSADASTEQEEQPKQQAKKGWFGFGR